MNNNTKDLEAVADKLFYEFYNELPQRWGRFEVCKNITILAIDKIISALSEFDNETEKNLQEEFPDIFSCQLQNMDWDFRYWNRIRKIIENKKY